MSLLIIDDDEEDIDYFMEVLRGVQLECDCLRAGSCEDAFKGLDQTKHPLSHIFLDSMLYGMSSEACLTKIKNIPALSHVKVVIYSGFLTPAAESNFRKLGADQILIKPRESGELERELRIILGLIV
jgi:DNA-binding response OmpR family regulator